MSHANKHFDWCIKNEQLKKVKMNKELALKHLLKSDYNYEVALYLEDKFKDWAVNACFYSAIMKFVNFIFYRLKQTKSQKPAFCRVNWSY